MKLAEDLVTGKKILNSNYGGMCSVGLHPEDGFYLFAPNGEMIGKTFSISLEDDCNEDLIVATVKMFVKIKRIEL